MTLVTGDDLLPLLHGHVDIIRRENAIQPVRLRASERAMFDPVARHAASMTTGIRLRFQTRSRHLRLVTSQRQGVPDEEDQSQARYEIFIGDRLIRRKRAEGGARVSTGPLEAADERAVLSVECAAGMKQVELWFPPATTVAIEALELDQDAEFAPWPDERPVMIFHGGSLTHGLEAPGASESWSAIAARLAGGQSVNLGWAGSCLVSGLAARILRDTQAGAIVLELGADIWPGGILRERSFADATYSMLAVIREGHPRTPIIVVSPILSPERETVGENGGLSYERMRALLAHAVETRRAMGDAAIAYISGLDLLGPADVAHLSDGCRPSGVGHALIGKRFHSRLGAGRSGRNGR